MTEDVSIIVRPKRNTICELFPITESVQLDEIARRELRTVNEFWTLCKPIYSQVTDIFTNPWHENAMTVDFLKERGDKSYTADELREYILDKVGASSPEDFDYARRSAYFMGLLRSIGMMDANGSYIIHANLAASKVVTVFMGESAIVNHFIRKYPFIRFDIVRYVQFVTHWDKDVDRFGCPRVSIDGYRNLM